MKRGKPLKRRTPLKRKTWMRARSRTNKYARRPRNFVYMGKVRRLGCFVRWWLAELDPYQEILPSPVKITTCYGPVQVDHIGPRAKGQRSADEHTMAACKRHHQERTDYRGPFKDWNAEMMRTWCDWAIRVTAREISDME